MISPLAQHEHNSLYPDAPLFAVGFSLGANVLGERKNFLVREGATKPLTR